MAITPLPSLDRTSSTFKTDVDTYFLTQLPAFASEANALQTDVNSKQSTASTAATTATTQAGIATDQAAIALAQAASSSASALSALNAPGTSASSSTSLSISTGTKTLTITSGKAYAVGQFIIIANTTGPGNYMIGQITAHNSSTGALTLNVTQIGGSGTFAAWTIALTAVSGGSYALTIANLIS